MSTPGTGFSPTAARSRALPLPPLEVPRALFSGLSFVRAPLSAFHAACGASENPDFFGGAIARIWGMARRMARGKRTGAAAPDMTLSGRSYARQLARLLERGK